MSNARWLPILMLGLGCVTSGTVRERADAVDRLVAEQHEPMQNCAPVELARAEAYAAFARHESAGGRSHTAGQFLDMAETNARDAFTKSRDQRCLGDEDNDGVPDRTDQCPKDPEDLDGFQDDDGCPDPDNDNDTVLDAQDACPSQPGPVTNRGCPVKDSDGDGLADDVDRCPMEFGPKERHGCPIKDSDKDGVPDDEDQCPDKPGPPDNLGCPYKLIQVTDTMIVLKEKIFFAFGKAVIQKKSFPLMDEIVQALRDHPTFVIRIEGHTDSVGANASNQRLSEARANAVRDYLVRKGIEPARLKAVGYGEDRPIDDNATDAGRAVNRRVEFHIESR